jgi:hypothetical protein
MIIKAGRTASAFQNSIGGSTADYLEVAGSYRDDVCLQVFTSLLKRHPSAIPKLQR